MTRSRWRSSNSSGAAVRAGRSARRSRLAPVPQQPPLVAGTPNAPIAAPIPQYGFETGYRAAVGPRRPRAVRERRAGQELKEMLVVRVRRRGGAVTPEQRQYAIGAVAIISTIAMLAIMWFAFGASR